MRDSFLFETHPGLSRSSLADVELFNVHWKTVPWTKHEDQPNCFNCDRRFSFLVRYHHCRSCGNCICHKCSIFKPLPCFGYKMTRVCKYCCGLRQYELYVDMRSLNTAGELDTNISKDKGVPLVMTYVSSKSDLKHQRQLVDKLVSSGDFSLDRFNIHQGDYHMLHVGTYKSRKVMIKCYLKWFVCESYQQFIIDEINSLRIIHHPNISRIIKTNILTDGSVMDNFPYMVTEYSDFGTLADFCVDRYFDRNKNHVKQRSMNDWKLLVVMMIQIVQTMRYLDDSHHLMHNNIHTDNIIVVRNSMDNSIDLVADSRTSLVSNPSVLIKIVNFTNIRTSEYSFSPLLPSLTHRAPEIWRNEKFNLLADVFSFGQLLAQVLLVTDSLFLQNYPILTNPTVLLSNAICGGTRPPVEMENSPIGIDVAKIIDECWKDVDWRPSFQEIEHELIAIERKHFS